MIGGLRIAVAQINPTVGAINENTDLVRDALGACRGADLVVFPELAVCGYMPEDLVLSENFIRRCMAAVEALATACVDAPAFIITSPWEENGAVYNAALLVDGGRIVHATFKNALPTYGVFDEARIFARGPLPEPMPFRDARLGIMICEDMWYPQAAAHLKARGADIIIVPNGSPFEGAKHRQRLEIATARVEETGLPLLYVNQVGGQDEIVYDGGSFALDAAGLRIFQAPFFERYVGDATGMAADLDELPRIYAALVLGLRDYVAKNRFPGVLLGMSGGIDSALSAAIAVDALGPDRVRCVMLPSPFTSRDSLEDAQACAKLLGCYYENVDIGRMMTAFGETIPGVSGVAHENMQSRMRGLILMSMSNASGWMVLTTGNKSEVATGYTTLYGDMCGGYNALKDVYKTLVYDLSRFRNSVGVVIPERILTKAPSAELRENQTDQDSLPPYEVLDGILRGLIEERLSPEQISRRGYNLDMVRRVERLVLRAEHKRRQSAPGPKITALSFGRERRMPITNGE